MKASRLVPLAAAAAGVFALASLGCHDHSDTTTAPGAIATLTVDAPDTAHSGQTFDVAVRATAVGINNVHNGRVDVTLPAPLAVSSVNAPSGTSATFANGAGATVTWDIGTLDSNSQSSLHVTTVGTLAAGAPAQTVTIQATMTADGIRPGDAVAQHNVQVTP
jgi:hypothetical protein